MKSLLGVMSLTVVVFANMAQADQATRGHLLIIGGGLLSDNSAIYERLISYAGGPNQARVGILPTASTGTAGAERIAKALSARGVAPAQIQIIDITPENAEQQTSNPAVLDQIRGLTALFMAGGDQRRITRALLHDDGSDTAALKVIRDLWERGGLIAGTSAGAEVLGDMMISVSGLPEESLDFGMDALDFGLTRQESRRGVLVRRGLGFFRGGLIDQHFDRERGRLGRLARVAIDAGGRFGFGIDENTALDVAPNGTIEIVGGGYVTVIDAAHATCTDGPLGCRMTNIRLSCLGANDLFDLKEGRPTIHRSKTPIVAGSESMNGTHLIPDIAGREATRYALTIGLGDNTSRRQIGVTLKYNRHYGHGYQFTFTKSNETRSFRGIANGIDSYAVLDVLLNVEPVLHTLEFPAAVLPPDLPQGSSRGAAEAVLFRGILLVDDQRRYRPDEPISRGELAAAISQTIHLEPPRRNPPRITDVPPDSPAAEEIALVVAARLMATDAEGAFHVRTPVTRQEAAAILVRLYEVYNERSLPCDAVELADAEGISADSRKPVFAAIRSQLITAPGNRFQPGEPFTRQQAAAALYGIIGFPW